MHVFTTIPPADNHENWHNTVLCLHYVILESNLFINQLKIGDLPRGVGSGPVMMVEITPSSERTSLPRCLTIPEGWNYWESLKTTINDLRHSNDERGAHHLRKTRIGPPFLEAAVSSPFQCREVIDASKTYVTPLKAPTIHANTAAFVFSSKTIPRICQML